nr:hypothetical protein [Tanacetum cinerariifolium]
MHFHIIVKAKKVLIRDVPEMYMKEFSATATVHHHSVRFKKNNKKQEILAFLRYLRHIGEIKKTTDVNINKLHQPCRSFAAVINKCLSRKSTGYDSLRDDQMFTMIKLVSRHQNTQQFGAILPFELTNEDIRNSAAYKEYYGIASGEVPPKTKASVSTLQCLLQRLQAQDSRLQQKRNNLLSHLKQKKSSDKDDDVDDQSDADDDDNDDQEDEDDQDSDNDGDEFVHPKLSTPSCPLMIKKLKMRKVLIPLFKHRLTKKNPMMKEMMTPSPDAGIDSLFKSTPRVDVQVTTTVAPIPLTAPTRPPPSIPTISQIIKEQVKVQVFKILPKIEKTVNEQLEAKVLTRSSNSLKTSYAMAADLSELELKKILIEKIESNKSIYRSDEQRNLQSSATHRSIQPWIRDLAKQADSRTLFNELMDTPVDFSAFLMNRLKVDTLTPELLAGVKSYQKKLNLTKMDTYRTDLKRKEAYTSYSNPRGFMYHNKDKQNRLMRIDELHKFSDGTLNNVQTALDDRLKGIQMKYLPQTIWRRSDKERAAAMIQDIDRQLKTRRIMRSLEMFVGGRLYEGDFRMLQRTI